MPTFITQKDFDFFGGINNELAGNIVDQVFYYHNINKDKSKIHKLYGEVTEITYDTPIRLKGLINYSSEDSFEQGQLKEESFIEIYITKKTLVDNNLVTNSAKDMIGNHVTFGNRLYEILQCTYPKLVYGQHEWEFGTTLRCKLIQFEFNKPLYNKIREVMKPLYQIQNFSLTADSQHKAIFLQWDKPEVVPNGYLILMRPNIAITDYPIDNIKYEVGDIIGNSQVIFNGNTTNYKQFGLSAETTYYFSAFTYNSEVTNISYLTSDSTTNVIGILSDEPIEIPSSLIFTPI